MPPHLSALWTGLLTALLAPALSAQTLITPDPSDRSRTIVTTLPSAYRIGGEVSPGDTVSVTQWVLPITASVPLGSGVGLQARTGVAASGGDVEALGGGMDTQVNLRATRTVGTGRAVLGLGLTLPTGGTPSPEQAETSYLVGQGFFRFLAPTTGQGLRLAPNISWAVPLAPHVAMGVGASYHVRGSFATPLGEGPYDPGNEALATIGADLRLQGGSALQIDLTVVSYGADVWDGVRYDPGSAVALDAEWTGVFARTPVHLGTSVRRRRGGEVPASAAEVAGLPAVVPLEIRAVGVARFDLGPRTDVDVDVGARRYAASRSFTAKTLLDVGVSPTILWTDEVSLIGRFGVTGGDLRGVQVVAGASWAF